MSDCMIRPADYIRRAKHLNVARELRLKFYKCLFIFLKHIKSLKISLSEQIPAHQSKGVAHPWSNT